MRQEGMRMQAEKIKETGKGGGRAKPENKQ